MSAVSDGEIESLVAALDDDGGGELSIDEIADFVARGAATFRIDDATAAKLQAKLRAATARSGGSVEVGSSDDGVARIRRMVALTSSRSVDGRLGRGSDGVPRKESLPLPTESNL